MSDNLTVLGVDYTDVTGIKVKGTGNGILTYIRPTGTKSITENGTGIDVAAYSTVDVSVNGGADIPTFTIIYNNDLESIYAITCDMTYSECYNLIGSLNSETYLPMGAAIGIVTDQSRTFESTVGLDGYIDVHAGNGALLYTHSTNSIPNGVIRYASNGTLTYDYPSNIHSLSITSNGRYAPDDLSGPELYNEVIVNVPSSTPMLQSKSATPTESQQTVTPDSGYDGLSQVTVGAISSTYVGSGITRRDEEDIDIEDNFLFTVPAGYYEEDAIRWPEQAVYSWDEPSVNLSYNTITVQMRVSTPGHISGAVSDTFTLPDYIGSNISRRTSSDLTASGATVTVPAGYYASQASKAVTSGTAGTPTASKGSVSNHSISITPSVTNTTGYITGGTKTGTAVSVSASELVSGTLSITSSGTKDVTNYASASVAAGGATASATKGSVSNHSISVTPSVTRTAGYVTAGTANGTAVTVSASELVSGNLALTDNTASTDVTNYATVSVNVPFVNYYTSSSNPTSSQGSNGDIWLVTS